MIRLLIPFLLLFSLHISEVNAQWFKTSKIADNTWLIDDHQGANTYVIEGRDSALVIDTGLGLADFRSAIKKVTDKPLVIVNTHAHPDHVGANFQFPKVYIHPLDSSVARIFMSTESREATGKDMMKGETPAADEIYRGTEYNTWLVPVFEGHIFDLGDRSIEVIATPGHTPGGISLLDRENRFLFSGDSNNILVWLFLPNCLPLSTYLKTLKEQNALRSEFDFLLPGHGTKIPSDFIKDQIKCVQNIIDGKCEPEPYESFAGSALVCNFGRAWVAYNPDNL